MATYAIRYIELPNGDVCDFGLFGIPYGACATAASTQAKAVTISGIATLREGLSIRVKFNNAQNYNGTPTLNLNNLGAKSIYRNGATPAKQYEWTIGDVLDLVYDGTNWIIVNGGALNTAPALEQIDKSTTKMLVVFGYQKNRNTYRAPLYFRAPASVVNNYTITPTDALNVNGAYFIPTSEISISKSDVGTWYVETANANAAGRIATLSISVT